MLLLLLLLIRVTRLPQPSLLLGLFKLSLLLLILLVLLLRPLLRPPLLRLPLLPRLLWSLHLCGRFKMFKILSRCFIFKRKT